MDLGYLIERRNRWRLLLGLAALMVLATAYSILSSLRIGDVDLQLAAERCIVTSESGVGISGFTPVSKCVLSGVEVVSLGRGTIAVADGGHQEAGSFSLRRSGRSGTSFVELTGVDLAFGGLRPHRSSRVDITAIGVGEIQVGFSRVAGPSSVSGGLSLGDSCQVRFQGYRLFRGMDEIAPSTVGFVTVAFRAEGGAGSFADSTGEFRFQIQVLDRPFQFMSPLKIDEIRFLNREDRCAGIGGGVMRMPAAGEEIEVPRNACIRCMGSDLRLGHLGLPNDGALLEIDLSGRFGSLIVNETEMLPTRFEALAETDVGRVVVGATAFLALFATLLTLRTVLSAMRRRSQPAEPAHQEQEESSP